MACLEPFDFFGSFASFAWFCLVFELLCLVFPVFCVSLWASLWHDRHVFCRNQDETLAGGPNAFFGEDMLRFFGGPGVPRGHDSAVLCDLHAERGGFWQGVPWTTKSLGRGTCCISM